MPRKINLLVGLLLILMLGLVGCGSNPTTQSITLDSPLNNNDWPQAGHDAAQTAAIPTFAINTANVASLKPAWVYHSDEPLLVAPVVVGNNLYLNNGRGTLIAFDRTNGNVRWTFKYEGRSETSPVATSDRVWLATNSGLLYSLNAADGKTSWQHDFKRSLMASPSYSNNTLWLASLADVNRKQPAALIAVDATSGNPNWQYELPLTTLNDTTTAAQTFRSVPPIANNAFWLPDRLSQLSGGVIHIDANQRSLPEGWANPNQSGLLAQMGAGPTLLTTLARNGGAIAVAADKALTTPSWYFGGPADADSDPAPRSAAFSNHNFVYTANDYGGQAHLIALDEQGQQKWQTVLASRSLAAPTIAANLVWLGDETGQLTAFDLATGKQVWQYSTDAAMRAAIIPGGDVLYAASGDGNLYAFGLNASPNTAPAVNPGSDGTSAVYTAPDQNGNGQIYALKNGQPVQLTQNDFALADPNQRNVAATDLNRSPAISPDGRKIAFVSASKAASTSTLYIMNSDGSQPQALADANAAPTDLAWTPDNQSLMFVSSKDGQLYIYNFGATYAGLHAATTNYHAKLRYPQATPDNRYILWVQLDLNNPTGVGNGRIGRLDRDGQNPIDLLTGLTNLTGFAVSPLNGLVAYAANDPLDNKSYLWLTDAQASFRRKLIAGDGPLNFAPDGRLLYATQAGSNEQLALSFDPANNPIVQSNPVKVADHLLSWVKPAPNLTAITIPTFQPAYFPTTALQNLLYGKYVFSANGAIYESDAYGVRIAQLTSGDSNHDSDPKLSLDGTNVVFVRQIDKGQPQIWTMNALGQNPRQLTTQGSNSQPNWSGDGKSVVYISRPTSDANNQVWTLDIASGETSAKAIITTNHNYAPAWSPDNKTIVFATDRDTTTASVNGQTYNSTNLFKVAPDGTNLGFVNAYKIEDGWLGVSDISFQPGGRYIAFTGLRIQTQNGKTSLIASIGVHDILDPSDFNNNTNCVGIMPTWVADKQLACIQVQPAQIITATDYATTEPAGTWARGLFDVGKKPEGPPLIMLDPGRFQISGLSWAAK